MPRSLLLLLSLCLLMFAAPLKADPPPVVAPASPALVRISTTQGSILLQLDAQRAPLTVANFLQYVRDGFYVGTTFHRVIPGFMVQGGGYDTKYALKPTRAPVVNESGNGLSNLRGTVSMARTDDPHSANSQFFISVTDNEMLNPSPLRWGYAVFGKVVEGMDVVDRISNAPSGAGGPFQENVPAIPIVIERAEILGEKPAAPPPAAAPAPAP
jgi:cyclophilin family peptidyl-prolyl cis-trans isomerase